MKIKWMAIFIGIALSVLNYKNFIKINIWWIVLCFGIAFMLFYIEQHKKNKEQWTPRPVYFSNPR